MKVTFSPEGVCPTEIQFEVENDIVKSVEFTRGCPGNLKAIATLLEGMHVNDVINKLDGITCGSKTTSCTDQLAKALKRNQNL